MTDMSDTTIDQQWQHWSIQISPTLQISIGFMVRRRDTITIIIATSVRTIIIATSVRRYPRLLITTMLPRGVPGSTYTTEEAVAVRVVVLPDTTRMTTTTRIRWWRWWWRDDDEDWGYKNTNYTTTNKEYMTTNDEYTTMTRMRVIWRREYDYDEDMTSSYDNDDTKSMVICSLYYSVRVKPLRINMEMKKWGEKII